MISGGGDDVLMRGAKPVERQLALSLSDSEFEQQLVAPTRTRAGLNPVRPIVPCPCSSAPLHARAVRPRCRPCWTQAPTPTMANRCITPPS